MGRLGGCSFMLEFGWWDREGGYHIFSVFVMLLIFLSWLVHDSLLCLFNCSFFTSFASVLFN